MDGGAHGGFGRAAFSNAAQYADQVVHTVGIANIFGGSQRFVVGQARLRRAEADKAALQHVEGQSLVLAHELPQSLAKISRAARLEQLSNAFIDRKSVV